MTTDESQTPIEARVSAFIARDLVSRPDLLPIGSDTLLVESGILDSLSLLKLLVFLEEEYHVEVDDSEFSLLNFSTVRAISDYVRSHQT